MADEVFARPTAAELVGAVREWLDDTVRPDMPQQHAFHLRVAINALSTVERELVDDGVAEAAHQDRLVALGAASDAALSALIRADALDGVEAVRVAVLADVEARLAVSNPDYILGYEP